eukprot:1265669-Pyramimonas_sp.AAC.1
MRAAPDWSIVGIYLVLEGVLVVLHVRVRQVAEHVVRPARHAHAGAQQAAVSALDPERSESRQHRNGVPEGGEGV